MKERKDTSSKDTGPRQPRCSSYGEQDFVRYLGRAMTDPEVERFEAHTEECDECLKILYRCHVEREKQKDEEFARRSMALHSSLLKARTGNLLEIVIKASGRLFDLVSTTGELLRTPAFAPARGGAAGEEKTEPLRIVKEFASPPISVQASAEMGSEGAMELRISLFDREKEEFMPEIGIELAGAGIREETMSDENGEVSFTIARQGDYRVTLTSGSDRIGEINLTLEM